MKKPQDDSTVPGGFRVPGALSNAVDNNRVVYDGAGLLQSIRYGGVSVFEFLGS